MFQKFIFIATGSSNGRTLGFGPSNRGSSPCPVANAKTTREGVFWYTQVMEEYKHQSESIEKIKPSGIIAGGPGIGKTTFVENYSDQLVVLDLDSNPYRKYPAWPDNYLNVIENEITGNNLVLISSYPEIVKELVSRGYEVTVVCAGESLEDEYRERYVARGNRPEMVERLIESAFASNDEQIQRFDGAKVIFMKAGQYLTDILDL